MLLARRKTDTPADTAKPEKICRKQKLTKGKIIALSVCVLLAVGAGIGIKILFFTKETKTALTESTTYGSLSTAIEGTATTVPNESSTVTVASTAQIEAVYVSAGDTVAVGDPLYVQDDSELDDQINDYQDQIADLQDQLSASVQQLATLQKTMSALTVTAPFSGRLIEVSAETGDSIQKGAKLATLVDDSSMTLTEYFSYAYESQISAGMSAGVSVADLMLNLTGTVTAVQKVERVTAEGTRCFAVTISVANPGALAEGMSAGAYLAAPDGTRIYPAIEGTLAYANKKTLSAEAAGDLSAATAVPYQKVSAGERLFTIDGSDYESQISSAQNKITQTQERIASYQEQIAEVEEKRSDYAVTAAIAGKVIAVNVKQGEKPRQAGMAAVVIYNLDSMTISANIDELDIDSIEKGMNVTVVRSGAEKDSTYEGTITEISYEATNSNGVAYFPVTVAIPSNGELSAGINVSYYITTGDAEEGVLAPVSALKSTTEGTCLFVKSDTKPEGAVELEDGVVPDGFWAVSVEVGTTNSKYARILSGVEQDTEVFTRYQNAAPANGDTTSQGDGSDTQQQQQGFPGNGQMPDFSGGGMPNMGGGSSGGARPG